MDNVRDVITTIKEKHRIDSDNPKAPYGEFTCEYLDAPIRLATWKEVVYKKYNEGDKVNIKFGNYEDGEYGQEGGIIYIKFDKDIEDEVDEIIEPRLVESNEDYAEEVQVADGTIIVIDGKKFRLEAL